MNELNQARIAELQIQLDELLTVKQNLENDMDDVTINLNECSDCIYDLEYNIEKLQESLNFHKDELDDYQNDIDDMLDEHNLLLASEADIKKELTELHNLEAM